MVRPSLRPLVPPRPRARGAAGRRPPPAGGGGPPPPLAAWSEGALDDPRVTLVVDDLVRWSARTGDRFDAICLDIDNGPSWTVRPANAAAYEEAGVDRFARLLAPGGTLTVWSAAADDGFRARLEARFAAVTDRVVPVARGEPDRVYVARGPR
jgi:spermidine synthase